MGKKIFGHLLFVAALAGCVGMTLLMGSQGTKESMLYNLIFLAIMVVLYFAGLIGGFFRMSGLEHDFQIAAKKAERNDPTLKTDKIFAIRSIDKQLKDYVFKAEVERLPWIPGVQDVLHSLKEADIPSMLVTTSPRRMAENIMKQADGLPAGYVCGDDPYEHKPSPAPYLAAAERLGIAPEDMVKCVVMEDSSSGLRSGAASGATLIAQTGWIRTDTSGLGQFASIDSYEGIDAAALDAFVRQRLGE